jgi:hypothetical protein
MQRPPDLATEIARLLTPEGLARLAAEHTEDGTGHCRTCPAGAQAGRTTWPCHLAALAAAATEARTGRRSA